MFILRQKYCLKRQGQKLNFQHMERNLGMAIFHDHFILSLPTFAVSNAHCWLSPQSRDFSGQTIGTPQADFSISIRLKPVEK